MTQDDVDLYRFQSTSVDCRRLRPREEEALALSVCRSTKLELVFAHPDPWTQDRRDLTNLFAKLTQGGLSVSFPGSERAARGDPNRARLALIQPYQL